MTAERDPLAAKFRALRRPFKASDITLRPVVDDRVPREERVFGLCAPYGPDGGMAPLGQDHYCGEMHRLPARHLHAVGHAAVTERLLDVDPAWGWEPLAQTEDGLPVLKMATRVYDNGDTLIVPVGMWIRLTVLDIPRIGFGSCSPWAYEPEKELIGDAIRNAAMRYGVATYLWRGRAGELDRILAADADDTGEVSAPAKGIERPRPAVHGEDVVTPPRSIAEMSPFDLIETLNLLSAQAMATARLHAEARGFGWPLALERGEEWSGWLREFLIGPTQLLRRSECAS